MEVGRLRSDVSDLCSELSSARTAVSPAVLDATCAERDDYLGLFCSLFGQFDHHGEYYGNLLAAARGGRSSLCRGFGPLLEEFRSSPDPDDEVSSTFRTG